MPIYEYRCDACDCTFEVIQKFSDDPLDNCEKCGAEKPEKLVSSSAFHLKGSGWYATDYGGKTGGTPSTPAPKTEAKPVTSDSE
jgi:putative FmdB family regulatory protein